MTKRENAITVGFEPTVITSYSDCFDPMQMQSGSTFTQMKPCNRYAVYKDMST